MATIGAALTKALEEIGLTKYALARQYAKQKKLAKETAYARTVGVSQEDAKEVKKTIRILDEVLECAGLQVLIVPKDARVQVFNYVPSVEEAGDE
jgi:NADP-dependent 3-hydroxy acid dehydrogenase YdfG